MNKEKKIQIRRAAEQDSLTLLNWRNNPLVYKFSLNPKPVDPGQHKAWFQEKMSSHNNHILIGETEGQSIGVVRFDLMGGTKYLISITVNPLLLGQGIGSQLLLLAESWLLRHAGECELIAKVKNDNTASQRLFKKCGYVEKEGIFMKVLSFKDKRLRATT